MQPGRYVYEISRHLALMGNTVRMVSDGFPGRPQNDRVGEIAVRRLSSVRFPALAGNAALEKEINDEAPDVVLWHIGMSSLYHLRFGRRIRTKVVGLFTSPVYDPKEMGGAALGGLLRRPGTYGPIVLGALTPRCLADGFMKQNNLRSLIVMNDKTANTLAHRGIDRDMIHVVPNGLDKDGQQLSDSVSFRRELSGVTGEDFMALYLGSPEPYRGVDIAVSAVAIARRQISNLKLVILSRTSGERFSQEEGRLRRQIGKLGLEDAVTVITGFQSKERVRQVMAAADVIVLPFRIVTSGVPLSILEAMALGKPLVSTTVDAIADVLGEGRGYLVNPGDPAGLARALRELGSDRSLREEMGRKAGEYVRTLPDWRGVAERVARILESER